MCVVLGSQSELCARYGDFKLIFKLILAAIHFVIKWLRSACYVAGKLFKGAVKMMVYNVYVQLLMKSLFIAWFLQLSQGIAN